MAITIDNIGSNMTELRVTGDEHITVLFSYNTPVAARLHDGRAVRTSTKWSSTTSKHINKWFRPDLHCVEECDQEVLDDIMDRCITSPNGN
tara:strand:+ start:226 stop:498 length:273 start_codon:yes stop_codon:yes gene_type:complete